MATTVADELLYKFKADATQLFKTYDEMQKRQDKATGGAKKQTSALTNAYTSAAKSINSAFSSVGGKTSGISAALQSVGGSFSSLARAAGPAALAIGAVTVAWTKAIRPAIEFNAMLEQQETAFKVMLGSAYKATVMMQDLKDLSMTTPIGFAEGAISAKQLIAYGFAQNEIITNMKMLATVASATGTSVGDLTYVYGTLRAQGQAYTRDLMQFGMRGIPIFEYLATVLETDVKGVRKLTEEGKVGFAEVQKAFQLMTSEGGKFDGLLEESMKTLTGLQTIMKNSFQMGMAEAVKPLIPLIKAIIKSFTSGFLALKPIIETVMMAIAGIGIVLQPIIDAINIVLGIFGLVFSTINMIIRVLSKIEIAGKSIGSLFLSWMNPLSQVASWISKIVAGINKIARSASGIGEASFIDIGEIAKIEIKNTKIKEYMAGELAAGIKQGIMVFPEVVTKSVPWGELTKLEREAIEAGWKTSFGGAETAADIKKYTDKMKKETTFEVTRKEEKPRWDLWKPSPEFVQSVQKTLNNINDEAAYSWQETVSVIMASLPAEARKLVKITDDEMAAILKSGELLSTQYWDAFTRQGPAGSIPMLVDAVKQYGGEAAKVYVSQWDTAIADVITKGKRLGDSQEAISAAVSDAAKQGFDSLNKSLDILYSMEPQYLDDEQFKIFLKKLEEARNRYRDLIKETGDAPEDTKLVDASKDVLAYMKSRAEWMNAESDDLYSQLGAYTGISALGKDVTDNLERGLALIEYQFSLQEKEIFEKRAALEIDEETYNIQMSINDAMKARAIEQERLNQGLRVYKEAMEGSSDYWTNLQAQAGASLALAKRPKTNKDIEDRYSNYSKAYGTAAQAGLQGTNLGSVMAGADPIMMLVTGLVSVVAQMEEFSQTLNFIETIGKGFAYALQQADKAFRPLNTVLMMIGEMLGAVFGPIIEMMGTYWSDIAQVLAPIVKWLTSFFKAVMPLVILFWKLSNPIMILFEILSKMIGMSEEELELKRQQIEDMKELYDKEIKSLQDLYNVGAISGKQYEQMLADLKAGMATGEETQADGGIGAITETINKIYEFIMTYLYPIFEVIAEAIGGVLSALGSVFGTLFVAIGEIVGSVFELLAPLLGPLTEGIKLLADVTASIIALLIPVLEAVELVIVMIKGAFDIVWASIKAFFTGDWASVGKIATAVGKAITDAWTSFWNSVKSWFNSFVNVFIKAINGFISAVNEIPGIEIGKLNYLQTDTSQNSTSLAGGSYAVGTSNVPNDMVANIHKGEIVVPSSFADAIRKGEMTLGGARGSTGTTQVFNITVEGNVISERDFYKTVGSELTKLSRQGYV